ncbi:PolC-type DNA polymerase III [Effusibacillus dendaii]|uniref:DNA polymerase III PolC-type n=1 Tax=Effusibacillus dendaii TaxID=2743772 RepID=A0A7I8DBK3_9BACL|nr:PolC-type DNA polymerase III [Effusibacillus dendaii]BCJ85301.1 DNA polymerase III PolC-type [Effusibacillus dendaii]
MNLVETNGKRLADFRGLLNLNEAEIMLYSEQIVIERVIVSRSKRQIKLYLACLHRLPSAVYQQIKQALQGSFPLAADVQIHFRYPADEENLTQWVTDYWPIAVESVCGQDPVSSATLRQSEMVVEDRLVSVSILNRLTMEHLQKKGFSSALEKWFRDELGLAVQVKLQLDEQAQEKEEHIRQKNREAEQTLVEQMRQAILAEEEKEKTESDAESAVPERIAIGRAIEDPVIEVRMIGDEMRKAVIKGEIFDLETRELASGRTLFQFHITDFTDSILCKLFAKDNKMADMLKQLSEGKWLQVRGSVQFDTFAKELVLIAQDLFEVDPPKRTDTAEVKRVELHLHTQMSTLDGVTAVKDLVSQAAKWGHPAIAITDHGVVQSFPDAYSAAKKAGIKCILGLEAYLVDDGVPIVYQLTDSNNFAIDEETSYIVFDTETTGLNAAENTLIEIAAVKMKGMEILEEWTTLIDPETEITPKITELTGITNEMVKGQPKLAEALPKFREFVGEAVLVAHNAEFDLGFISACAARIGMQPWTNPVLDTLPLARKLYPSEKNYRLKTLTQKFGVELVNHHRALDDTVATAKVFQHMLKDVKQRGMTRLSQLNENDGTVDYSRMRPIHTTVLVQNKTGLKNLYKLVSESHVKYFYRYPRIPRSLLAKHREGLLIGTACQQGELMQAILRGKSQQDLVDIAGFYDYLEIQPLSHYKPLLKNESVSSLDSVKEYHRQIVEIGRQLDKPVVATGDVHFLNPEDEVYRDVFLQSLNDSMAGDQPPLYFMTTNEMLDAFSYLGEELAHQVVVENSRLIADRIEEVSPIPDRLYTPVIEGAEDELKKMCYETAKRLYGDPLPEIVEKRLEKELNSIITNGFAVIYLISSRLVKKSLSDGYLVGSRGSVGSSLVATFSDITEVNPLPPHYLCPQCKYSEFIADGSVGSGFDLPNKDCPKCGHKLKKDGQDIPFETFLGFKGDKVPDIDLNFSGEYQPRAHKYTQELFGVDYVYRAGTIATVAEKTAFGYVKKYGEERGKTYRNAEVARLVKGCTGIKRTTGQHPGGIIVVPDYMDIYDFCPIQFPADDNSSEWRTTHFDFHSIHDNLLKLDILGHDDPTVIRMLQDLTELDPKTIPTDDPLVMSLFSSTEALGVKPEQIRSNTGTYGIPEFGTKFVRQMLEDTKPSTFAELVQISGLSHGTDVWLNNAQELIRKGICKLADVIGCRDDIMVYLIYQGLEPGRAFKIMESVRKGKGVSPDDEEYMKSFGVPDWYIWSCKQIKYMFPKAHASAYVLMAVRIAWFKVYRPLQFYATYFSVRADDFDLQLMCQGYQAIWKKIEEIEAKGMQASPKEKSLLTVLEMALEMTARGFKFYPLDLYKSDATRFQVLEDGLLPPFGALAGVGESAAKGIVAAREQGEFLSVEDLQQRSRASKTVIELLQGFGCLQGLPETNQLSLF